MRAPAAAAAAMWLALTAAASAQVTDIAPGLHLLPGRLERGRQPDGNSLLLEGPGGVIVFDTGRHAEHTQALLDWSRQHGLAITTVVNSHWHLDHLGGNALLRRAVPGLQVHASAAVARALDGRMAQSAEELRGLADNPQTDEAGRAMARIDLALLDQRKLLAPDHLIEGGAQDRVLAGRRVRLGVETNAVSGGDVWLLDPASGVLAAGDLVTLPVPFLDTACAAGWRVALGHIEALPFSQLVPGHGPVMSRDDFRRWRRAFDALLDCASGDKPVAACSAAWAADLGPLLPAAEQGRAAAMLDYYFAQHLRAAPAQRERWC
jgi:glyoxylase-like metal-dependent hydrolase (beta-lactamase superfamily II)